ncbi:unnamed protein product [Gongylonema pulchrum]|uniref:dihydrofolate reductase n=1 Tax=Gongylonema pulchrum TaxID=637853 RepID=A0A183ED94_9BILA|nr:unnamed protein product [Gongylonema pulchrum]
MNLIVAVDDSGGIGKNGALPWRLPREMARFAKLTSTTNDRSKRNAVLMGRKVWEEIPAKFRPLKDRLNVLYITRVEGDFSADVFFPSVDYSRFTKNDEPEEVQEEHGIKYRYEIYTNKSGL